MGIARERYEALRGVRSQFLDVARAASHLTLPYLIKYDSDYTETHKTSHHTMAISWCQMCHSFSR